MEYRVLTTSDFNLYDKVRADALDLAPDSFLSTNEEEKNHRKDRFCSTAQSEFNFVIGAFDGTALIGLVTFIRESRLKTTHKGGIYGMFVYPEYQGKGIGAELLKVALDKAFKFEGLRKITLSVTASNKKGIKLYERAGFTAYGTEKEAFSLNDIFFDEVLMVKFKE